MDEKRYHAIADATLMHCFDQLEDAFESGMIDELELESGILTIRSARGRTFLLNKHAPSLQLWYASPISGGLHFSFSESEQRWQLPDGRLLYDILRAEMSNEDIAVVL
ncbi:MAG: iron donor protein CyaY [Rickettsiales bacterium]|nr:iron donor protein CyaY [Rickettsiales bacterium]